MRTRILAASVFALLLFPFTTSSASAGIGSDLLVSTPGAGPANEIIAQEGETVSVDPQQACGADARSARLRVWHYDANTESGSEFLDVIITDLAADGHWNYDFALPGDFGARGGWMEVGAQCRYPEGVTASYYSAFILLGGSISAPASAAPGATITVSGDVCPNGDVIIRLDGVQQDNGEAGPDGVWTTELDIPADAEVGSTLLIDARCRIDGSYNYRPVGVVIADGDTLDPAGTADPVTDTPTVTG